jgi:ADP-ribose pyrophosphatase
MKISPLPPFDAATDMHLCERQLESTRVYDGDFLHVRRDRVALPDGSTANREYIVHPGAVMIVPLLDDGRLLVERQWRYPLQRAMLEFPAGKLERGEPVLGCAIRELLEETGYRAAEWARAGLLNNAIAYCDEFIEVWFARGLVAGERKLDAGEFLDVYAARLDDLEDLAARGEFTDAKSLIGLLWLQNWRAGRWPLVWQPAPAADGA